VKARIFVVSPYRAETQAGRVANIRLAWALCEAVVQAGFAPFAPHLFYTEFLDDAHPVERELGISCGLAWLGVASEVWVYAADVEHCSSGMRAEIEVARRRGVRVVFMPHQFAGVRPFQVGGGS